MREIADMVGAYLHVDMAHFAGLVAAGEHPLCSMRMLQQQPRTKHCAVHVAV